MSRRAGVQTAYLRLESIEDAVITLESGHRRAVLEVEGIPFDHQGSAEQESALAGYAAFLNSLTFPVQILVRAVPADLGAYLDRLERQASHETGSELAALARDHAGFVRRLQRQRTLLERRCYVIVPGEEGTRTGWRSWWWWPFPIGRAQDRGRGQAVAREQLALRCAAIVRELGRCGLEVRRLQDTELAQLCYACWCPDLSRSQRLRRDLADYTDLVVSAARFPVRTGS